MKVLRVRSSHKNSNSKKKQSQFSIVFILASRYLKMGCTVDPPPSGEPWETFYTAKWSTT